MFCFFNLSTNCNLISLQPIDKQSLLDSGIFCCLIHVLNALLGSDGTNQKQNNANSEERLVVEKDYSGDILQSRRLEVFFFLPLFVKFHLPMILLITWGLKVGLFM